MARPARCCRGGACALAAVACVALLLSLAGPGAQARKKAEAEPATQGRETYSVLFTVQIDRDHNSIARVRWDLSGIDEIGYMRLKLEGDRYRSFSGTGSFERRGEELVWTPRAPYAHLAYSVSIDHRRAEGKGFDSYASEDWILTRTDDLFPDVTVDLRREIEPNPEARARLAFKLPEGWRALSPLPFEKKSGAFIVEMPQKYFDRPWGWLLLGRVAVSSATIEGCRVTVGTVPGVKLKPERVLRLVRGALPIMRRLFRTVPPKILIVSGPDPMWRGGLSGESSFFLHGDRPLRTPDKTSPVLHELFHVLAPFRPAPDGHWVTEGLAEYYSLEIQRRLGRLTPEGFARGLSRLRQYGRWNVDITKAHDLAVTNNSAPLLMYALDEKVRSLTKGERSLDDAVVYLASQGGRVATADFLRALNRTAGKNLAEFFTRHVFRGKPPPDLEPIAAASSRKSAKR